MHLLQFVLLLMVAARADGDGGKPTRSWRMRPIVPLGPGPLPLPRSPWHTLAPASPSHMPPPHTPSPSSPSPTRPGPPPPSSQLARQPPPPHRRSPPPPVPSSPSPPPPSSSTSNCSHVEEQAEGPYWLEENLNRIDVRENLTYGIPLNLTFRVVDGDATTVARLSHEGSSTYLRDNETSDCIPIANARIDMWQARYDGLYSGIEVDHTVGETWLRGYQLTNNTGYASFYSIYPGWYESRTVHVHVRVRLYASDNATETYDETTQLYFDDGISDAIFANVYPYNDRTKVRDTYNEHDELFSASNQLTVEGSYNDTAGYSAFMDFSVPFASGSRTFAVKRTWTRSSAQRSDQYAQDGNERQQRNRWNYLQ